jgi:hypothetical protein
LASNVAAEAATHKSVTGKACVAILESLVSAASQAAEKNILLSFRGALFAEESLCELDLNQERCFDSLRMTNEIEFFRSLFSRAIEYED